jgi:hypothetical protein
MPKKNSAAPNRPRKPVVPTKGTKTPMPKIGNKPTPKRLLPKDINAIPGAKRLMANKTGVKVVMPDGSTVGLKDLGKVKPTPKPKPKPKVTPKTVRMTPQDTYMKKILEKKNGKIYG